VTTLELSYPVKKDLREIKSKPIIFLAAAGKPEEKEIYWTNTCAIKVKG